LAALDERRLGLDPDHSAGNARDVKKRRLGPTFFVLERRSNDT
jgi:hypothetical protein